MKIHKIHSRGDFLNKPFYHTIGAMFSRIVVEESKNTLSADIEFTINDCQKMINLDFWFGSPEDHENNIHKVNTMINHLEEFKRGLLKAAGIYFTLKSLRNDKQDR